MDNSLLSIDTNNLNSVTDLFSNDLLSYEDEKIKCEKCLNNKLIPRKHMDLHIKRVHKIVSEYKCRQCLYTCKYRKVYERHKRTHSSDIKKKEKELPQYRCNQCNDNKYFNKIGLIRHISRKHSVKTVRCYICDNLYTNEKALYMHIDHVHSTVGNYFCNVCDKYYRNHLVFEEHNRKLHTLKKYLGYP